MAFFLKLVRLTPIFAVFATTIILYTAPASAFDFNNPKDKDILCQYYANGAMSDAKKNRELQCGGTGNTWGEYYPGHYNWCMSQRDMSLIKTETAGRQATVKHCGKCNEYADATNAFEDRWNSLQCGQIQDLQQTDRYRGTGKSSRSLLVSVCMNMSTRMSTTDMTNAEVADNIALAKCQYERSHSMVGFANKMAALAAAQKAAANPSKSMVGFGQKMAALQDLKVAMNGGPFDMPSFKRKLKTLHVRHTPPAATTTPPPAPTPAPVAVPGEERTRSGQTREEAGLPPLDEAKTTTSTSFPPVIGDPKDRSRGEILKRAGKAILSRGEQAKQASSNVPKADVLEAASDAKKRMKNRFEKLRVGEKHGSYPGVLAATHNAKEKINRRLSGLHLGDKHRSDPGLRDKLKNAAKNMRGGLLSRLAKR